MENILEGRDRKTCWERERWEKRSPNNPTTQHSKAWCHRVWGLFSTYLFTLPIDQGHIVLLLSSCLFICQVVFHKTEPFNKWQNLDFSKLKEFADNNLKFEENGRKFSLRIENCVRKGDIARKSIFTYSHGVFLRLVLQTYKNKNLFGKGLATSLYLQKLYISGAFVFHKQILFNIEFSQKRPYFYMSVVQVFCKYCGKRRNYS